MNKSRKIKIRALKTVGCGTRQVEAGSGRRVIGDKLKELLRPG